MLIINILIDIEAASKVPGFVSFINHTDVPGSNMTGYEEYDEEVFVSSITPCIGVVVCETEQSAQIAAKLIHIDYELLTPVILTIEDAIANESYFYKEQCIEQGDVEKVLAEAEHKLEGNLLIGGQEHFYMETNYSMVIPSNDDDEVTIYLGTQHPTKAQD